MTKADKIKELCNKNGITVKKLEQDLGYGNGSLMKRNGEGIKHNRIVEISKYFNVPFGYFYDDEEEYTQAFLETHNNIISEYRLTNEAEAIAEAYLKAPEAIKEAVAKLLDVKRALLSSKEA